MIDAEAEEVAEIVDRFVFKLIDNGTLAETALPADLMQLLAPRRLVMQKLGLTKPRIGPPDRRRCRASRPREA